MALKMNDWFSRGWKQWIFASRKSTPAKSQNNEFLTATNFLSLRPKYFISQGRGRLCVHVHMFSDQKGNETQYDRTSIEWLVNHWLKLTTVRVTPPQSFVLEIRNSTFGALLYNPLVRSAPHIRTYACARAWPTLILPIIIEKWKMMVLWLEKNGRL